MYFYAGILLAKYRLKFFYLKKISLISAFLLFIIITTFSSKNQVDVLSGEIGLLMMFLVIGLVGLLSISSLPNWLNGISLFLGNISYGVYLWHILIFNILKYHTDITGISLIILTLILTSTISTISTISYFYFEKPITYLGRCYENKC